MINIPFDIIVQISRKISFKNNIRWFRSNKQYYDDQTLWKLLYDNYFKKSNIKLDNYQQSVILCYNLTNLNRKLNYGTIEELYNVNSFIRLKINMLPKIHHLINLRKFAHTYSILEHIPNNFSRLINLEYLDLSHNSIKTMDINKLTNLKELNLSNNHIKSITDISNLTHLRELNLNNNKIITIPTELCILTQLKELNLSHNKIVVIPRALSKLVSLCILNINYNLVDRLPKRIGHLKNYSGRYR